MTVTDDRYPEVLLQCGSPHGNEVCGQSLIVRLSLSDNATYMCNRGHRIGQVSNVDDYLMAMILGALSKPQVRRNFTAAMSRVSSTEPKSLRVRAFAEWWDGALPRQRYDVMSSAIERVLVAPESMLDLDAEPVVTVQWK